MLPKQLVLVVVRPINLNESCELHPYSLQRIRSPPEPCLPSRIRNTHPCNYYNLKGKDVDVHFLFWVEELYCELYYHNQKIRQTIAQNTLKRWKPVSTLFGLISSVYCDLPSLEIKPATTECRAETLPLRSQFPLHPSNAIHYISWFIYVYTHRCRSIYIHIYLSVWVGERDR